MIGPMAGRQGFENPWRHPRHRVLDVLRWKLGLGPGGRDRRGEGVAAPRRPLDPSLLAMPPAVGWRVVWLGHASFLLQGAGRSLLVDPVFSAHFAPVPVPGLRRRVEPPCMIGELPAIDGVLLSHGHYDHLDLPTLGRLPGEPWLLVPEGHGRWLERRGFRDVRECGWWGSCAPAPGLEVVATPAQHFSARGPWDWNRAHWCGWRIEGGGVSLWHAGDSGYCPAFRQIGERLGPVDLAMIPIGAYDPRWLMAPMHLNPEEAVRVFLEVGARRALAMHWGTFRLTDEPLDEPPRRLTDALAAAGIDDGRFRAVAVGEVVESAGAPRLT